MHSRSASRGHRTHTSSLIALEERSRLRELFRRQIGTLATLVQQLRKTRQRGGALARYYLHDLAARYLQRATEMLPRLEAAGDTEMGLHRSTLEHFREQLRELDPAARD